MSENQKTIETHGPCGKTYIFKAEYGDCWVQCPDCKKTYQVPSAPNVKDMNALEKYLHKRGKGKTPQAVLDQGEHPWQLKYEMTQVDFLGSETYTFNEQGKNLTLAVADRPGYLLNGVILGVIAWLLVTFFILSKVMITSDLVYDITSGIGLIILALWSLAVLLRFKFYKRHTTFYTDIDKNKVLFKVKDESQIEFPKAKFTVIDKDNQVIGYLEKPWAGDILRTQWHIYDENKELLLYCEEDSALLALLRRFFFSKLFWFRINYVFKDPEHDRSLGEFYRSWTLNDHYIMDLSANSVEADLRLLMTLSMALDSVERR